MTTGGSLPAAYKKLSVLRRVGELGNAPWRAVPGVEGSVGVFRFPQDAAPIIVEAVSGRSMTIVPGDVFLATPGYRESVRWTVGGIPAGGLVPGDHYWVLSESGVMGELASKTPAAKSHLGRAEYLGAVLGPNGYPLRLKDFTMRSAAGAVDAEAPVYLVLGTSVEVGKTTAGLSLLRTLLDRGHDHVVVLKATGTTSVAEAAIYFDFGAAQVFDCLDFGVPTTFPCERPDAAEIFSQALDFCLSVPSDAVLIECGGDFMGTCVPEFLQCLRPRRASLTTILAASDTSGALGAKHGLERMGVTINLITGPCTDTSTGRQRVEAVCGIEAKNMRS
jgi:Domain of unknown function (DUF1611_C) P-loop domain